MQSYSVTKVIKTFGVHSKSSGELGELRLAASTLYSANTYEKLGAFFKLGNIPFLCKTSYYNSYKQGMVKREDHINQ